VSYSIRVPIAKLLFQQGIWNPNKRSDFRLQWNSCKSSRKELRSLIDERAVVRVPSELADPAVTLDDAGCGDEAMAIAWALLRP